MHKIEEDEKKKWLERFFSAGLRDCDRGHERDLKKKKNVAVCVCVWRARSTKNKSKTSERERVREREREREPSERLSRV